MGVLGKIANAVGLGAVPGDDAGPGDDDEADCDFDMMELGNQPGIWRRSQPSIKYAYDNNLLGEEISVHWIGRTKKGECNDLTDTSRQCWYTSKMLNDPGCKANEDHCLHYVAHDGTARHTFTCPTWVKDGEGRRCKLPAGWQACPQKFTVQRVDGGVPMKFKAVLRRRCPGSAKDSIKELTKAFRRDLDAALTPKAPQDPEQEEKPGEGGEPAKAYPTADDADLAAVEEKVLFEDEVKGAEAFAAPAPKGMCEGPTEGLEGREATMIFDVHKNRWYRCSDEFRCEAWDIEAIKEGEGQCGEETCTKDEQCFTHTISSKRTTLECIRGDKVWVISDSDDKAKTEAGDGPSLESLRVPPELLLLAPDRPQTLRDGRARGGRQRGVCFL